MNFKLDHIGIQTNNFENTVKWYEDFFGCKQMWYKKKEDLPEAIQRRMPLAYQLVELQKNDLKFHVFDLENPEYATQPKNALFMEHFCVEVETFEELKDLRKHWISLFESGNYTFQRENMPTEIIPSSHGMQGFYAHEPNGIELEVFYLPKQA